MRTTHSRYFIHGPPCLMVISMATTTSGPLPSELHPMSLPSSITVLGESSVLFYFKIVKLSSLWLVLAHISFPISKSTSLQQWRTNSELKFISFIFIVFIMMTSGIFMMALKSSIDRAMAKWKQHLQSCKEHSPTPSS